MIVFNILVFLLSIVPAVLIYVCLRKRKKDDQPYRKTCKTAFISGIVSALPIIALSGTLALLNLVLRLTLLRDTHELVYHAIYKFVALAFAEEIIKFVVFYRLLKKKEEPYTWADTVAFMVIIGTAFGLLEDIPYAIGADAITMLVRGFTMGHVGYGFLMGWFFGKRLYTGKKRFGVPAVAVPWLLHGAYDFSLTPELLKINDNFAMIAVALAVSDLVLLVLTIRFFLREKKKDIYRQPVEPIGRKADGEVIDAAADTLHQIPPPNGSV